MAGFRTRLANSFRVLFDDIPVLEDDRHTTTGEMGTGRFYQDAKTAVLAPIVNQISLDAANLPVRHTRVGDDGLFIDFVDSKTDWTLRVEPNIDENPRDLFQSLVTTVLEKGYAALVPVRVSKNPNTTGSYDVLEFRVGVIEDWSTHSVDVLVYNPELGQKVRKRIPKDFCVVIQNPLFNVMNHQNSTLSRLQTKLSLLDKVDTQSASGKLNLLMQMPFATTTDRTQQKAEARLASVENQLYETKYGIAYIGASEKAIQLNRPVDNNLMERVTYLTGQLFNQLGLSEGVFSGEASQEQYLHYYRRAVFPIMDNVVQAMRRTLLTRTAITQGQSFTYFFNPLKMVSVDTLAETADKFTRNEIASPNEFRAVIGLKPSDDPKADELRNRNVAEPKQETQSKELNIETGGKHGE